MGRRLRLCRHHLNSRRLLFRSRPLFRRLLLCLLPPLHLRIRFRRLQLHPRPIVQPLPQRFQRVFQPGQRLPELELHLARLLLRNELHLPPLRRLRLRMLEKTPVLVIGLGRLEAPPVMMPPHIRHLPRRHPAEVACNHRLPKRLLPFLAFTVAVLAQPIMEAGRAVVAPLAVICQTLCQLLYRVHHNVLVVFHVERNEARTVSLNRRGKSGAEQPASRA